MARKKKSVNKGETIGVRLHVDTDAVVRSLAETAPLAYGSVATVVATLVEEWIGTWGQHPNAADLFNETALRVAQRRVAAASATAGARDAAAADAAGRAARRTRRRKPDPGA